jgi:Tol biopolymer transport system component
MGRLVLILTILAMLVAATSAQATYPGRNGGIAYGNSAGLGEGPQPFSSSGIVLKRSRFEEPRDLLRCDDSSPPDCTSGTNLSFSPDGKLIAFEAGARIGLLTVRGGAVTLLPAATADDGDPAFTPNGKRIVFTGANDHGTTDLYVRSVDGAGSARLLIEDAAQPAVSARGVIAYVRSGSVYLRFPKHGKQRRVTAGYSPDWSPDGHRLVVVRLNPNYRGGDPWGRLYTVRANGQGLTRFGIADERDASHPVWSPNGRFIAYDREERGIYVRRLGSHRINDAWAPTQRGDEDAYNIAYGPAWRPL